MKLHMKTALVVGALALGVSPAALAAGAPETTPPNGNGTANGNGPEYAPGNPTPGPKAGLPAKAKAYGRYCQGESKKHVKGGEPGTAFSRCVTAAAKLRRHEHEES